MTTDIFAWALTDIFGLSRVLSDAKTCKPQLRFGLSEFRVMLTGVRELLHPFEYRPNFTKNSGEPIFAWSKHIKFRGREVASIDPYVRIFREADLRRVAGAESRPKLGMVGNIPGRPELKKSLVIPADKFGLRWTAD